MRRVRSTKRNCRSVNKRYRKKHSTRRMHGGAWYDSFIGSTPKTSAPTVQAAEAAPAAQASTTPPVSEKDTTPLLSKSTEPKMTMNQRMAGFTTLGTAAYVANRMEDKIDFLMQKEGLDDERKNIDAYWKRSQQGYFNKKQSQ
jgi:hypothetical protein